MFVEVLKEIYSQYTPEFAAGESGVDPAIIVEVAREIGRAGSALATHVWRNAAAGNLGGWQVSRALEFLTVLMGAIDTMGGTAPSGWNKYIPAPPLMPPAPDAWNEMMWAREYPLAFFEMSFLLPHFLKEKRGKLASAKSGKKTSSGTSFPGGLIPMEPWASASILSRLTVRVRS